VSVSDLLDERRTRERDDAERAGPFHILVPVDGTPAAEAALAYAVRIARASNARLDLLAVVNVPSTTYWGGTAQPMELVESVFARILRCAADTVTDVPVTTYLARGSVARAIVRHAETNCCDLIVMGSRGRGRLTAALLGSVSQAVRRRATVPVLLLGVRDAAAAASPAPPEALAA
jgi:nucleotide-binding universal stress UspA family protein